MPVCVILTLFFFLYLFFRVYVQIVISLFALFSLRNVKGSQEVVDFVADRLREQKKNNELNLTKICEEVNLHHVDNVAGLK